MSESVFLHDLDQHDYSRRVDYWKHFNLKQSPFDDAIQLAMYYPVPAWQSHINYLHSFCEGKQPLLLIQGEAGVGKSMLIANFVTQLSALTTVANIKGRATITPSQLISVISHDLQLSLLLSQPSLFDQVQTALNMLQQTRKHCLLIIDDADLLPAETLSVLTQFALQQREHINLYIILLCELNLQAHIENTAELQGQQLNSSVITLSALTREETRNYIKHRLTKAGFTGKFPFNKEILNKIQELSAGVPSRINRVVQQKLSDFIKQDAAINEINHTKKDIEYKKSFPTKMIIKVTTISMFVVVTAFLFWKTPQKSIATETTNLAQIKTTMNTQTLKIPDKPVAIINPVKPTVINPEQLRTAETAIFNGAEPPPNALNNKNISANKPIPAKILAQNIEKTVVNTNEKIASTSTTPVYTLQLLGSRSISDLHRAIKIKRLAQTNIFMVQLENKPWYILLYGKYASASEAKAAQKEFAVADIHPWIRPLSTLEGAMQINA